MRTAQAIMSRPARAFTLTELVVAVGAAAILTASVGLLFRSVGDLSSAGISTIQLDAAARVLEKQLRDDFDAMSRLSAEETFFAIRFREVGDIDRDTMVDPLAGERAIYLSPAQREADLEDEIDPYAVDSDGDKIGRAITTRLDEMVFLGESSYVSAQAFGAGKAVEAPHARIYYGHGLKPLPDPNFDYGTDDVDQITGRPRRPVRQYVPDGDFGARAGDQFDFALGFANGVAQTNLIATGRNEYASGWSLARQAALLYGGNASATTPPPSPLDQFSQTIGDRSFAPYIRDTEFVDRWNDWSPVYTGNANPSAAPPVFGEAPFEEAIGIAEPRFLQGGRVDIINQDLGDVVRWLEGEYPRADITQPINFAGAYSAGYFADSVATLSPTPNGTFAARPLWLRWFPTAAGQDVSALNLVELQSAIAGVFARPLMDDRAPLIIDRRYDPNEAGAPDFRERPDLELMDTHALIASRCSRFEIAWTDGTTVIASNTSNDGLDINGDTIPEYRVGDLVWFDITPIFDSAGDVIRRNTLADWVFSPERDFVHFADPRYNSDAPVTVRQNGAYLFPEVINDDLISENTIAGASPIARVLDPVLYSPIVTGGSVLDDGTIGPEAYAVWGFREPLPDGRYGRPWAKPTLVRVRVTLHDRELRTTEGRTYEFIFPIHNRAE